MRKVSLFVLALLCTFSYVAVLAQEPAAQPTAAKQARWEGVVQMVNTKASTLTVKKIGGTVEKTIHYNDSTKWVSQEHGSKKVNKIEPSEVKEGDRVICKGTQDKGGFHATVISKRLTPM